ncbi:MAG: hypothetical protein FJX31_12175 [Alphaproteobacteria bacterium]|nr:hypothetical protein [Alphaproteobacteria bacterium]
MASYVRGIDRMDPELILGAYWPVGYDRHAHFGGSPRRVHRLGDEPARGRQRIFAPARPVADPFRWQPGCGGDLIFRPSPPHGGRDRGSCSPTGGMPTCSRSVRASGGSSNARSLSTGARSCRWARSSQTTCSSTCEPRARDHRTISPVRCLAACLTTRRSDSRRHLVPLPTARNLCIEYIQ